MKHHHFKSRKFITLVASLAFVPCITIRAEETIKAALQQAVDHHIATGVVGLVANKDKILDIETAGISNQATKAPMQKDSLFWIASMTKSFTAAALMMLVDEGKVKIDDPVEMYLPEFKNQMVADKDDPKKLHLPAHPITIKEVLSHTSGLILAGDKSLKHTNSLKDDVAQFAAAPLLQEPGTKFQYNNSGINTAARIIEVLSGMPYADFLQRRILDPVGMKDTTFWPTEEQGKRLAYSARFTADKKGLEDIDFAKDLKPALIEKLGHGVAVPHDVLANYGMGKLEEYYKHYADGAGGLFSTAADVAKFAQWLLNKGVWQGKRLLSEESVSQLGAVQTGEVIVNPNEGYGLGMFVKKRQDESVSVGSFGHRGARRTVFWVDPTNQIVVVLLVQRMDMDGNQQKEMYGAFFKAAVERFGKSKPGS